MARQSRIDSIENVKLTWCTLDDQLAPPRPPQNKHASLGVPVELGFAGSSHPGLIHSLSRFGAFVRCDVAFDAGVVVSIGLLRPTASTRALVIHHITDANAARLGTVSGVGLRFRDPVTESDVAFGRVVAGLVARANTDGKAVFRGNLHEVHLEKLLELLAGAGKSR